MKKISTKHHRSIHQVHRQEVLRDEKPQWDARQMFEIWMCNTVWNIMCKLWCACYCSNV